MKSMISWGEVERIEEDHGRVVVAVIFDGYEVFDHAFTWETAQCMVMEGYTAVAIADDGHMSATDAQRLYDAERDRYVDCFG